MHRPRAAKSAVRAVFPGRRLEHLWITPHTRGEKLLGFPQPPKTLAVRRAGIASRLTAYREPKGTSARAAK